MSKFNAKATPKTLTENLAGGAAYTQTKEMELVSILLTSFADDQYYRKGDATMQRVVELIGQCDKKFVAKAIIYARTQFGMRSITHVAAAELAKHISGESWARHFYSGVINRPDDMLEIASYYFANLAKVDKNNKRRGKVGLPKAMVKGFAAAFNKFNNYSLAKYRGEGKDFKLIDLVNLVHPKANEGNKEALNMLVAGKLKSTDTWESMLTAAGQKAGNDEELGELKKEAWEELINTGKIGYFALLRNLRNIIEQAPNVVKKATELLLDENRIKKSLVLPFRFTTAYKQIMKMGNEGKNVRDVLVALSKAVDIAVNNCPVFEGETLVVLDESGSMTQGKENRIPAEIGALFAAVLCKANNCDLMTFANNARFRTYDPGNSTLSIANAITFNGGGTNFHSIFQSTKKAYDRIIILSDMQGWIGYNTPAADYHAYCKRTGAKPFIYSFDLAGYGTLQLPESKVFCVAGFSDKILSVVRILEQDRNALMNTINSAVDL